MSRVRISSPAPFHASLIKECSNKLKQRYCIALVVLPLLEGMQLSAWWCHPVRIVIHVSVVIHMNVVIPVKTGIQNNAKGIVNVVYIML